MRKDKHERAERQVAEQAWKRRLRARTLEERFPAVESLQLSFSFGVEEISGQRPEPRRYAVDRSDPAFFEYACPLDCHGGGFFLDQVVTLAVSDGLSSVEGHLFCHGLQRPRGPHRCSMRLHYRVDVENLTDV